ncbi:rCG22382, partial [Rattus norvegicus]
MLWGHHGFEVVSCLLKTMSFYDDGLLFSKFLCM